MLNYLLIADIDILCKDILTDVCLATYNILFDLYLIICNVL